MAQAVFVHDGVAVDYTPGAAVTAGDVVIQGQLVGVAKRDIAANELGALHTSGVFDFLKEAALAITDGARVYWNDSGNTATTDGAGGARKLLGYAVKAAGASDATVRVQLGPAIELGEVILNVDIADGSADATYYVVSPYAGTIEKIYSVIDGVVSTADITITAKIGSTAVTNGVVTIATASSAAGDVDSATPTAENVLAAGAALNLVVAGGGSGGSPRVHVAIVLKRTY